MKSHVCTIIISGQREHLMVRRVVAQWHPTHRGSNPKFNALVSHKRQKICSLDSEAPGDFIKQNPADQSLRLSLLEMLIGVWCAYVCL
jgi:hypothetical protein